MPHLYEAILATPMRVLVNGKAKDVFLAKGPRIVRETLGEEQIVGLSYDGTWITHMAYGLSYADPYRILSHAQTKSDGWFYFDAGTSMPEIKVEESELQRCFRDLGLVT